MDDRCNTCGEEVEEDDTYLGDAGEICEDCYYREQEDDGLPD